jgi:hypothetical protein
MQILNGEASGLVPEVLHAGMAFLVYRGQMADGR